MKKFGSLLLVMLIGSILLCGCASSGSEKSDNGAVQDRIPAVTCKTFPDRTTVKVYQREVKEYPCQPLFKYVDVINQAINYKQSAPQKDVVLNFAMYNLSLTTLFYFDQNDEKYGEITSTPVEGRTENIVESLVRLAKNNITVNFVAHSDVSAEIAAHKDELCNDGIGKVGDYLNYRYITWGDASEQQMHCKFLTVNKIIDDAGKTVSDVVYVASSNIDGLENDAFKSSQDRNQDGMLMTGNAGLYDAFNKYHAIIFANNENQTGFQESVRAAHKTGLNYSDEYIRTQFSPVQSVEEYDSFYYNSTYKNENKETAWDTDNNMFAKYLDELAASDAGSRMFYANMYHYKTAGNDLMGWKVFKTLKKLYFDPSYAPAYPNGNSLPDTDDHYNLEAQAIDQAAISAGTLKPNAESPLTVKWIVETSTNAKHRFGSDAGFLSAMKMISDGNALYYKADSSLRTHCKEMLMSYKLGGKQKYVTICGSCNLKMDGCHDKGNASVAFIENEKDHQIFDAYKSFIDRLMTEYLKK